MKKLNLVLLLTLIALVGHAQNDLFSNLQGLSHGEKEYFELGGVSITIIPNNVKFDDKGIKKIKKSNKIKNIIKEYRDTSITEENLVIEASPVIDKIPANLLYYLFPKSENKVDVITFASGLSIETSFVKQFINSYLNNQLSQYILHNNTGVADSISFIGRKIVMGGYCRYMDPNNVQCPNNGQMSWSIFDSKERAEEFKKQMMFIAANKFKLVDDTMLNVIFEGTETKAHRRVYKAKFVTNILLGGHNLCVYYITQKVRDYYVTAILSYYMKNDTDFELDPLLQEVMSLE